MAWSIAKTAFYLALLVAWALLGVHLWREGMELFAAMIAAMFAAGVYVVWRQLRANRLDQL